MLTNDAINQAADWTALHDAYILVVDDNIANVQLLLDVLEDEGYTDVKGLTDPREVEDEMARRMPDLLLLDIRMPHLDGHTLLARMRARWHSECPPVMVLTAQTDQATRSKALSFGARDFLNKPFDQREALQRIRNILEAQWLYRLRANQATVLEQMVAERTAELERMAEQEPVTGLPNRRALLRILDKALSGGGRPGVVFVALDGLDDVARLHGYPVSEALLRKVTSDLENNLDEGLSLGCWGGNELVLICLRDLDQTALVGWADNLLERLTRPLEIQGRLLDLDARVGIALGPKDSSEPAQLVRLASLALPPPSGPATRFFAPVLEEELRRGDLIRKYLRGAVERGELSLAYQPKVDLNRRRIVGAEALIRWHNPELGHVSPAGFIPLAESSGQILGIGAWVLETVCRQAREWLDKGVIDANAGIAVNVAARQLANPMLATQVLELLDRHGLPPSAIEIEVTESGLMEDVDLARSQLAALAAAGVGIAIDDFGTGYSSLAYLKTLPVTTLKIDRSFVRDLVEDANDRKLASTVIAMAHNFGHKVVAEGIETPHQARLLLDLGCEIGQGYWFARPMSGSDFVGLSAAPPDWQF